jgi:hypothetical protein
VNHAPLSRMSQPIRRRRLPECAKPEVIVTRSLDPLLDRGLRVVFVGTAPGKDSISRRHYYADPTKGSTSICTRLAHAAALCPRAVSRPAPVRHRSRWRLRRSRWLAVTSGGGCTNRNVLQQCDALRAADGVDPLPRPWRRDAAFRFLDLGRILVWATSDSSFNASAHWPARLDDLRALSAKLTELNRLRAVSPSGSRRDQTTGLGSAHAPGS